MRAYPGFLALLLAPLGVTLLASCAIKNEGAVDFRRVAEVSSESLDATDLSDSGRYFIIRNEDEGSISSGEFYQINLKHGLIRHFTDIDLKGDIAILARVFEVGGGSSEVDFTPDALGSAKLIYYSDDVGAGQPLNLSQIPIFGPVEYRGNPVILQIYGVDIDELSGGTKALMQKLISVGTDVATAYNPAVGNAANIVGQLGEALLSGNSDDIIFAFSLSFASERKSKIIPQDYLMESERIFIRSERRDVSFDWAKVKFDPALGTLVQEDGNGATTEFREETYFVIDIVRAAPSDMAISHKTYKQLVESIAATGALNVESTERAAELFKTAAQSAIVVEDMKRRLTVAKDVARPMPERVIALRDILTFVSGGCPEPYQSDLKIEDSDRFSVKRSLRSWIARSYPENYEFLVQIDNLAAQGDLYSFAMKILRAGPESETATQHTMATDQPN